MKKIAPGLILLTMAGCVLGSDETGSVGPSFGEEPTVEAASAVTGEATRDIASSDAWAKAVHTWLSDKRNWPTWKLYYWGTFIQIREGKRRYDQVILAVPEGAPAHQWLRIHSAALEDDAGGYFQGLLDEGRLSIPDLLSLEREFRTLRSVGQLPQAGHLAYEYLEGMSRSRGPREGREVCSECTPASGPEPPGETSHAGEGGPIYPPNTDGHQHQRDEAGGEHFGPGWVDPAKRRREPAPPRPSLPEPNIFHRAYRAINRIAAKAFVSKRDCTYTCNITAAASAHAVYVCQAAAGLRAIPQIGVPCSAIEVVALGTGAWGLVLCPMWCDTMYDMFPEVVAEKRQ